MPESVIQRAFTGGELAPALGARADLAKYTTGLKTCRNFLVQRHGGAANRPGTQFLGEAGDGDHPVRLLPFIFEANDQTYLLEVGHEYIRFYWHDAPVVVTAGDVWSGATAYVVGDVVDVAGTFYVCILGHTNQTPPDGTYWLDITSIENVYQIPTPYVGDDLAALQVTQSADTLLITHPDYVPYELKRVDAHSHWQFTPYVTAPTLSPPASPSGTNGAAGTRTLRYVVTAHKAETFEESHASSVITLTSVATPTESLPNSLSWTAVSGAVEYSVYLDPFGNGQYGFIGTAATNAFSDPGLVPDFTITPPIARVLFNSSTNYPATATYHQQRLAFARTLTNPEEIYTTKVGAYHNVEISTPLQDDDAITFTIASKHLNPVAHLVSIDPGLVIGSDEAIWLATGDESGVLTPAAIHPQRIDAYGMALNVAPLVIGDAVLYVQSRGTTVRELRPGAPPSKELSVFADHLFKGYSIVDLAFQQIPFSIVWAVRSDGVLLGCTYFPDEQIAAWHRHDTEADGEFEAVCVLPDTDAGEDVVYVVVKRTIGGSDVRYIERLASRTYTALAEAFFVDCGLTYRGSPATMISGLDHLEGETVAVLADGAVALDGDDLFVVNGGVITLGAAASVVHVGLPITADLQTLDLDVSGTAVRDKRKLVTSITALVEASLRGYLAGPSFEEDDLIEQTAEPWEDPDEIVTGPLSMPLTAAWGPAGRVCIRQENPLPLTVLGILPSLEVQP